jgi:hypothetical protein
MKPANLVTPVFALLILVALWIQTSEALKASGSWGRKRSRAVEAPDPYAGLERQLAQADPVPANGAPRDPFFFSQTTMRSPTRLATHVRSTTPMETPPPQRERPVLTAIIADEDPRAIVRYEDKSYSVRAGDLFAEFRVVSVSADGVELDQGGQRMVLRIPRKGD